MQTLGDIEHEIDLVGEKPRRQILRRLDEMHDMPGRLQAVDDRLDRVRTVELGITIGEDAEIVAAALDVIG